MHVYLWVFIGRKLYARQCCVCVLLFYVARSLPLRPVGESHIPNALLPVTLHAIECYVCCFRVQVTDSRSCRGSV